MALRDQRVAGSLVLIEPMLAPLLAAAGDAAAFADYKAVADRFLDAVAVGDVERAWSDFVDYRNGAGTWARLSEGRRARFVAGTQGAIGAFRANLANPTSLDDVRAIHVPTTIVCGGMTTTPDRRVTEILHEAMGHSRLEVVPGAEHMSPLTHPDPVAALIRQHCLANPLQPDA
ncbi:MAG: alpha/beta fold hydrolase [Lautropia sp.]